MKKFTLFCTLCVCMFFALPALSQSVWQSLLSKTTKKINSVTYGVGRLICVGESGLVLRSLDRGKTWTSMNSGLTENLTKVVYGKNAFVAVGQTGLFTSSDSGLTWKKKLSGMSDVAFGNNIFVAVGNSSGGKISSSTDGLTWTSATPNGNFSSIHSWEYINDVTFANGKFTIVGQGLVIIVMSIGGGTITIPHQHEGFILRCGDGISWDRASYGDWDGKVDKYKYLHCVHDLMNKYSLFAAIGDSSTVRTSSTFTWTTQIKNFRSNALTFMSPKLVAVGDSGMIYSSENLKSWTRNLSGTTNQLFSVSYGNSAFWAVGAEGTILKLDAPTATLPDISGQYDNVYISYTFYLAGGAVKVNAWAYRNWTIVQNGSSININGVEGYIDESGYFYLKGMLVGEAGGVQEFSGQYDITAKTIKGKFTGTVVRLGTDGKYYTDSISDGVFSGTKTSATSKPVADFSASPLRGDYPLLITFQDKSTGSISSYLWDFGDGATSTLQNPQHTYTAAGTFTVKLQVTNAAGSDEKVLVNLIAVTTPPPPQIPVAIPLRTGWNLISWNVDTADDSTTLVLKQIMPNLVVAMGFDSLGSTYDHKLPAFSTLPTMDHLHGYWLKMSSVDTLRLSGMAVDYAATSIHCRQGWNLVSYLPEKTDSVAHCFSSLLNNNLVSALAYNGDGLTYSPALSSFSTLKVATPFLGYWLKLIKAADLRYPQPLQLDMQFIPGSPVLARTGSMDLSPDANENILPTVEWMNVYGENLYFRNELLAPGTVITAREASGSVCGSFVVEQPGAFGFMPVYRDDPSTQEKEGPQAGEAFCLYIDDNKIPVELKWTGFGDAFKLSGAFTAAEQNQLDAPSFNALWQNYPNPFNPQTTISYQLNKPGIVKIIVRNLLGQEVAQLMDEFKTAGLHKTSWDGCDKNGTRVPSGLYLYTVTIGDFSQSRKMLLLY